MSQQLGTREKATVAAGHLAAMGPPLHGIGRVGGQVHAGSGHATHHSFADVAHIGLLQQANKTSQISKNSTSSKIASEKAATLGQKADI